MLGQTQRELSPKEQRLLRQSIALRRKLRDSCLRRSFLSGFLVSGVIAGLALLVGNTPKVFVGLFFVALWLGISSWIGFPEKAKLSKVLGELEQALAKNRASTVRVTAETMIEFEEIEDEGACYAFQVGEQIVFICGQDFYRSQKFPNTDFEIVEIHDSGGRPLQGWIEKHGKRLEPLRTIPAAVKKTLHVPGHLKVIAGKLENLEDLLRVKP